MKQKHYLSYYIQSFLIQYIPNERGLSENTILAYRDALKLFLKYCNDHLKIKIDKLKYDQINEVTVCKFLDYIEQDRGCTPGTRNARLAALKIFFRYLGREAPECLNNSQKISSIPLKKTPHKTAHYLEAEELKTILDSIDITARNGLRDKALLLLMHNTGARVQEIIDIELKDIRMDVASQVKLKGKGDKIRVCPLWKETIDVIKTYITERKPKFEDEQHLFLNNKNEHITRFGIRYIVRKYTEKAIKEMPTIKQKKISPHTFRHTTAMHLLQSGNELNVVRLWLGHADLNTTHLYVEINMEMKRKILDKSLPPNLKKKNKKWLKPKILEWLDTLNG